MLTGIAEFEAFLTKIQRFGAISKAEREPAQI